MLVEVVGSESGLLEKRLMKELRDARTRWNVASAEWQATREKVDRLRAEIEVLRSIVRGEVASIKGGKASDAA